MCFYGMGLLAVLHMLAFLFTHWSVGFKAFVSCSRASTLEDADMMLVVPVKFAGSMELVPLERRVVVSAHGNARRCMHSLESTGVGAPVCMAAQCI